MAKRCQKLLREIFEKARSDGDKTIVVDQGGKRQTPRKDFVRLVNSAAYYLNQNGIKAGEVVALELGRTMEHIALRLACHCVGVVYVSVNPDYPEDRKKELYNSCDPAFILDEEKLGKIEVKEYPCQISDGPDDHDPGVIIFTSGTTGVPKGILHDRSIYYAFSYVPEDYGLDGKEKTYAVVADMMFGVSSGDMFPIYNHWTMHILDDATRKNPIRLKQYFIEHSIQVTIMLPSLLRFLLPIDSLEFVLIVGERNTFDFSDTKTTVVNFYGCSEACAMGYGLTKEEEGIKRTYPLGRIYIIDEDGNEIEQGDTSRSGEVCFTGLTVLIKYLGEEPIPEEKLITGEGEEHIVRTFHTRDIGRYNSDGSITVSGRLDTTVKVRGNRVNTAEVEYAILQIPGVSETAVKSFEERGENYLCAYYSTLDGEEIDREKIVESLRRGMPEYMIPAFIIYKKEFEKNVHGKIDRDRLTAPEKRKRAYVKPERGIETEVTGIIGSVMRVSDLGVEDRLTDLGISSLTAIQIMMEIESRFAVDFSAEELMQLDTPRKIAEEVSRKKSREAAADPASYKENLYPMRTEYPILGSAAFILDRTDHMESLGDDRLLSYNTPMILNVSDIGTDGAKAMVLALLGLHKGLKAKAGMKDGKRVLIRRDDWEPEFKEYDLGTRPDPAFFKSRIRKFDIFGDDLVRCELYHYETEVFLFMDIHHLLLDGYSIWLFYRDFRDLMMRKRPVEEKVDLYQIIEKELEYRKTAECEENRAYYEELLAKCPPLKYPESKNPDRDVPVYADLQRSLNTAGIKRKCSAEDLTASELFMNVFLCVLREKLAADRFSIFAFYNGREQKGTEHTAGCIYRHKPVAMDGTENPNQRIRESSGHVFDYDLHQDYKDRHFIVYNYLAGYERQTMYGSTGLFQKTEDAIMIMPEYDFANIPLQFKVLSVGEESVIGVSYNAAMYSKEDMSELLSEVAKAAEMYIGF